MMEIPFQVMDVIRIVRWRVDLNEQEGLWGLLVLVSNLVVLNFAPLVRMTVLINELSENKGMNFLLISNEGILR